MKLLVEGWAVSLCTYGDGVVHLGLTHCDVTTGRELANYEFSGSSKTCFPELMSVLDASIFTSLAIAEGALPEGQAPLY